MKIPETYEEFLKTPKDEWKKIANSDLSIEEASKIMKFVNKLSNDIQTNKIVFENNFNKDFQTLKELVNGK